MRHIFGKGPKTRFERSRLAAVLAVGVLMVGISAVSMSSATAQVSETKISGDNALAQLAAAGIDWGSTNDPRCSEREVYGCTSFEQVNQESISGVITLKNASGCEVFVTGGTEVGHGDGTYSHWNGYKIDVYTVAGDCINNYVTNSFTYVGDRGDVGGAPMYEAGSGNLYTWEVALNHWDIVFYTCGC